MAAVSVSVVIPAYQQPELLSRAVRSVLAQQVPALEILVVDDGSVPPLAGALPDDVRAAIRLIEKPNGGGASARNEGVRHASGELVAFLDHDDEWLPEKLGAHLAVMSDPGVVLSYSRVARIRAGEVYDRRPKEGHSGWLFDALLDKSLIHSFSSIVVRREAMVQAGPFDESYRIADDFHFYFRLALIGRFEFIPEALVRYNIHADNQTISRLPLHLEKSRMFDELARQHDGDRGRRLRQKAAYHYRKAGDHQRLAGDVAAARLSYRRSLALDRFNLKTRLRLLLTRLP